MVGAETVYGDKFINFAAYLSEGTASGAACYRAEVTDWVEPSPPVVCEMFVVSALFSHIFESNRHSIESPHLLRN